MRKRWFQLWRLPLGGVSLRAALSAPLVLLILGTAGLTSHLFYYGFHRTAEELTEQILRETGQRIEQNIKHYLETALTLARTNAAALSLGVLDGQNKPLLENYFFRQLSTAPTLDGLAFANEQKDFLALEKQDDDSVIIRINDDAHRNGLHNYQADTDGNRQRLIRIGARFDTHNDPPGKPWYMAVKTANKPIWLLIVSLIEADKPILLLTCLAPFYKPTGGFQGATMSILHLSRFSHFLQKLRIGQTGQAFIVDRDGLLIAASTGEQPFLDQIKSTYADSVDPGQRRLAAVESQNPVTRLISRYLIDTAGGFQHLHDAKLVNAALDEHVYFLSVIPFHHLNLDWRIVIAVSETDFIARIQGAIARTVALTGAALFSALLLGILAARWISHPVMQLNIDAKRLAQGDFFESLTTSSITELRELIYSFKYMAMQLRQSFSQMQVLNQALADHQQNLETEIARRTEALRQSETRFRNAFEMTAVGMIIVSPTGHILQVNTAFREMLGYSETELMGCSFEQITFPDDLQKDWELARQLLAELIPWYRLEKRYIHKEGHIIWGLLSVSLVRNAQNQPLYAVAQVQDITERKQAEDALYKLNQHLEQRVTERTAELMQTVALLQQEIQNRLEQEAQLEQARKLEAVGRFTGGVAHDFNNLLTVIKGNLEILRRQANDKHGDHGDSGLLIEDALSAAQDGAELIAGLLAFSRQQSLRWRRIRLNEVLQSLERLLIRVLEPAIALRVTIDSTIPELLTDAGQLQAALLNLAFNARDAMPQGGTLDIDAAAIKIGAEPPIATHLAPGAYLVITVTDSGIGMDAKTLAQACEPFFTTKSNHGTGLGLSTAYGFAVQSGGGLVLQSQPGRGTTVRLFLPVAPIVGNSIVVSDALSQPIQITGGAETILVVEDQARLRRLACHHLHDLGYQTLEATNVEEAMAILETEPDLQGVFSDIVMPGAGNGYDLARWVTAHRPAVKCLLTTGYHDQMRISSRKDSPPVLAKPYSREQLAHQLRRMLDER